MAWAVSSIKDSLLGWLTGSAPSNEDRMLLDAARCAMIELLLFDAPAIEEALHLRLLQRLRYARDLDALWYLRTELVSALAQQLGEREAQLRVLRLSHLFGRRAVPHRYNRLVGR